MAVLVRMVLVVLSATAAKESPVRCARFSAPRGRWGNSARSLCNTVPPPPAAMGVPVWRSWEVFPAYASSPILVSCASWLIIAPLQTALMEACVRSYLEELNAHVTLALMAPIASSPLLALPGAQTRTVFGPSSHCSHRDESRSPWNSPRELRKASCSSPHSTKVGRAGM